MNIFTKTVGILSVFCAVGPCMAALRAGGTNTQNATGRVSVATTTGTSAARRLPTLLKGTTTTTDTSSDSSLLGRDDCIEQYDECIKDANVCGANFEECTTAELFYAKKPQCNNVLLQCGTAGINALFGTSNITDLSADNIGVYPTSGSLVGQYIEAGHLANLYDTGTCVRRVTSCLQKDNVCGSEFELCTSNNEFKKQRVFCESNIARCQEDGIRELFGSTDASSTPVEGSRLRILIDEGADLAAANAVDTCHRIADQCILNACKANPYKCLDGSNVLTINIVDAINSGASVSEEQAKGAAAVTSKGEVNRYIYSQCSDTIGGSKYCYMNANGGKIPTASQLKDEYIRDEVFADTYEWVKKAGLDAKLKELKENFDTEAKDKCAETLMSCAMSSCGGGFEAACYGKVYGKDPSGTESINKTGTYTEIQRGCEAIVNTDANCQYAAAVTDTYQYNNKEVFTTLFPKYTQGYEDPIGVIAKLNGSLAQTYNSAAIERIADSCRDNVEECIISECGSDYSMCYRNRSDIMSDTYATSGTDVTSLNTFDASMNKVGGVLDFTIVRGLCMGDVEKSSACNEHLRIQAARNDTGNGWAGVKKTTVGSTWADTAKGYSLKEVEYNDADDKLCVATPDDSKCSVDEASDPHECGTVADGCKYDQPITYKDYLLTLSRDTLFREVVDRVEKNAQSMYNAQLTKEQNMCRAANNGGVMGRNDMASTYMWVKLNSRKVPKNYSVTGLKANEFKPSNDLYGSFCRARVTVQSDDPDIQNALQKGANWSTAYFAVGDMFTCGSWIPQDKLEEIAINVACKKAKAEGKIKADASCTGADSVGMTTGQKWATAASAIGSAALGGVGMDLLQTKTGLGGLVTTKNYTSSEENAISASIGAAEAIYNTNCTGNSPKCSDGRKCFSVRTGFSGSNITNTYTFNKDNDNYQYTCADINSYIDKQYSLLGINRTTGERSGNWWQKNGKRATVDAVGAIGLGITGGLAVGKNIKAANRQEFTKDQQEFMNQVGDHIYCFVGADEAGKYGDLNEISLD